MSGYDNPTVKNIALIAKVNALFTRDITGHSANSDGNVVFTTVSDHNFVVNDHVKLFNEIDEDNYITSFNDYSPDLAQAFKVLDVTKNSLTLDLLYNANFDISNLQIRSVYVFNNDQMTGFPVSEYPVCILSTGYSKNKANNANLYMPYVSNFNLTVLDTYSNHGTDRLRNTRINSGSSFVQNKVGKIMESLLKPINNNDISFGLSGWGGEKVFYSGLVFKY